MKYQNYVYVRCTNGRFSDRKYRIECKHKQTQELVELPMPFANKYIPYAKREKTLKPLLRYAFSVNLFNKRWTYHFKVRSRYWRIFANYPVFIKQANKK